MGNKYMKKLVFTALAVLSVSTAGAQNVYTGTVVDKKGNPVPGARVENVKGSQTAYTDMNGRFRLYSDSPVKKVEVAYPGYQSTRVKTGSDMLVRLGASSLWAAPDRYQWFIGLTATTPNFYPSSFKQPANIAWGIRFGRLKNWGYYVNLSTSFHFRHDSYHYDPDGYGYEVKPEYSTLIATAGVIRRLWCPLHLYLGLGYNHSLCNYPLVGSNGTDKNYFTPYYKDGAILEAGLMLRIKNIMVDLGSKYAYEDSWGRWTPSHMDQREFQWTVGVNYFF